MMFSATDVSAAIVSATEISAPPTDISALTIDISEKDTDISEKDTDSAREHWYSDSGTDFRAQIVTVTEFSAPSTENSVWTLNSVQNALKTAQNTVN